MILAPYVAPEVLSRSEYKAQPTDIWSCGIVLIAMLAGELPWDKPVYECGEFVAWIKSNNYQKTPWCKIENTALSLLKNILIFEPSQRFTIRQIRSSAWFTKIHKSLAYESINLRNTDSGDKFLSQPTYFYINETNKSNTLGPMAAELQVTDSQQNCECSGHGHSHVTARTSSGAHFESFSQPISTEHMFLNSQLQLTQNPNSQFGSSSQSPLLKLVKRMTRMFVHTSMDACTEELKKLFQKFMYDFKVAVINQRQRQITVSTSDKRQTLLTFKVNIIEMNSQNEMLVDFRLSKGDGLEFKKIFMKIKTSLAHVACKRYIFVNSHACCDSRN